MRIKPISAFKASIAGVKGTLGSRLIFQHDRGLGLHKEASRNTNCCGMPLLDLDIEGGGKE